MKRVLVLYGILLCALVISFVDVLPNCQQEMNDEDIQFNSFYTAENAFDTSGGAFMGNDMRGMPSKSVQFQNFPSKKMLNSQRWMQQSFPHNENLQVFAKRQDFIQDVQDRNGFNRFLGCNTSFSDDNSHFHMYVTPDNETVLEYLEYNDLNDKYDIYESALSWVWVSDLLLNGQEEVWLYPAEFLNYTPNYSSNPVSGTIVSDCEEQANTLASLLLASGEYNESSVRVAIGCVNFDGITGGHAWVEVYEDGEWFPLDATMGPYYNEDEDELVSGYEENANYYKFSLESYPVVELWYYYNNVYFIDAISQTGNAPDNWKTVSSSYF